MTTPTQLGLILVNNEQPTTPATDPRPPQTPTELVDSIIGSDDRTRRAMTMILVLTGPAAVILATAGPVSTATAITCSATSVAAVLLARRTRGHGAGRR